MAKKKLKMLLIDDSPIDREIAAEALKSIEEFDINTEIAQTGMEGLKKIARARDRFDLIIVDYKMPGISGMDFMNKLKEKKIDTPVIMATGAGDERIAVEVMKIGAYDYVIKDELFRGGMSLVIKRTLERYAEKQEKERLEAETREYANKLKAVNEELKKLNQIKSDFVSIVSHELRTPLSIIKEGVSLVLDELPGKINENQKEILKMSRDNIDRLAQIINDLLDISKIEAGKIRLKKVLVDLPSMVNDICDRWRLESAKKHQNLRVSLPESPINVYIDPDKIERVLTNLISNAIKFTPEKGKISFELKDKRGQVEISVSDTGIGIAKEDLPNVFSKFQQFHRVAGPGEKGTGLGLAISKELIEMHRGTIKAESELNKGSKFTFSLPKMDVEEVFKEYITNGIREAAERKTSLSLVVIHIARFNQLQKNLGSEKTQNLLKDIEKVVEDALRRRADTIIRDTGELIILLPDTTKATVSVVSARIEKIINTYLSESKEEWLQKISLTFNNATYPEEAAGDEELLNKARLTPATRDKKNVKRER